MHSPTQSSDTAGAILYCMYKIGREFGVFRVLTTGAPLCSHPSSHMDHGIVESSTTLASPTAAAECEAQHEPDHGPNEVARARDALRVSFGRAIADIPADAVSCIAWFLRTPPPPPRPLSSPPLLWVASMGVSPPMSVLAPTATLLSLSPSRVTEPVQAAAAVRDRNECAGVLTPPGSAPATTSTEWPLTAGNKIPCTTGPSLSSTTVIAHAVRMPAPMTPSDAVATAAGEGLFLVRERNASGYRHVYPRPSNKYKVAVERNGTQHCLGYFITAEEAALCAARWIRDHPSSRKHRRITATADLQLLRSTASHTLRDHVVGVPAPPMTVLDEDEYLDALIYDDAGSPCADGNTEAPNMYIGW